MSSKHIILSLLSFCLACGAPNVEGSANLSECRDGLDNDGDKRIDCEDPDCITRKVCDGLHETGLEVSGDGPDFCDPCIGQSKVWEQVEAGLEATCALDQAGWPFCFGDEEAITEIPQTQFQSLSLYGDHGCGIDLYQRVVCWGENDFGQTNAPEGRFVAVDVGELNSCAINEQGLVQCWGLEGDLTRKVPTANFVSVSLGHNHACGLQADNTVLCWGDKTGGKSEPDNRPYTEVKAGESHSCMIHRSGRIECIGSNNYGESDPPTDILIGLSAGHSGNCGLTEEGHMKCWGAIHENDSLETIALTSPEKKRFKTVSLNREHGCAVTQAGKLFCFGDNSVGQSYPP